MYNINDKGDFKPLALLAYLNRQPQTVHCKSNLPFQKCLLSGTLFKTLLILNKGTSNQVQQLDWTLSLPKWLALNFYLSSTEFKRLGGVKLEQMNRFYSSPGGGRGLLIPIPALLLNLLGNGWRYLHETINKIESKTKPL